MFLFPIKTIEFYYSFNEYGFSFIQMNVFINGILKYSYQDLNLGLRIQSPK